MNLSCVESSSVLLSIIFVATRKKLWAWVDDRVSYDNKETESQPDPDRWWSFVSISRDWLDCKMFPTTLAHVSIRISNPLWADTMDRHASQRRKVKRSFKFRPHLEAASFKIIWRWWSRGSSKHGIFWVKFYEASTGLEANQPGSRF